MTHIEEKIENQQRNNSVNTIKTSPATDPGRYGEDGIFDPATVIGLQNHHRVLVFGNAAFMPWLAKETHNIESVRKINDAVWVVQNNDYDRVIVGREFDFSNMFNLTIAYVALRKYRGLLVYFPKTEGDAWTFSRNVEVAFPLSQVWELNTTFGQVVVIDLEGERV